MLERSRDNGPETHKALITPVSANPISIRPNADEKVESKQPKTVKVLACREREAVIFDASAKSIYEYALFPGMCGCVGLIISDDTRPDTIGLIHYLGHTDPNSVLGFINTYFKSHHITITTFAGNAPSSGKELFNELPVISPNGPTITISSLPQYDEDDLYSDRNYYLQGLRNRYEVNYILNTLSNNRRLTHIHNNLVSFGDNVFLNLSDMQLSTNLNVNVVRDDYSEEDKKNPFFNANSVVQHDSLFGRFYDHVIRGHNNIVVTDKRSWKEYAGDFMHKIYRNRNTLFYSGASLAIAVYGVQQAFPEISGP